MARLRKSAKKQAKKTLTEEKQVIAEESDESAVDELTDEEALAEMTTTKFAMAKTLTDLISGTSKADLAEKFESLVETLLDEKKAVSKEEDEDDDEDDSKEESAKASIKKESKKAVSEDDDEDEDDEKEESAKPSLKNESKKAVSEDDDEDEDDDDDEKKESAKSAKPAPKKEAKKITAADVDVKEDIAAIVSVEDNLSEDFQEKAKTIVEAAIVEKVNARYADLHEEYERDLAEGLEQAVTTLTGAVDDYLTYAVSEWVKDNELAVDRGLRAEISEEFITGLHRLFKTHYIDISTDKVDVVEELGKKVVALEEELSVSLQKNVDLSSENSAARQEAIFTEVASELSDANQEKLTDLAEGVEYESDENYREKIELLKESYFGGKHGSDTGNDDADVIALVEARGGSDEPGPVDQYARAISRTMNRETQ